MFYIDIKNNNIASIANALIIAIFLCWIIDVLYFFYCMRIKTFLLIAFIIPFSGLAVFDIAFGILTIIYLPKINNNYSVNYISANYSDIYNRMFPHRHRLSYNGLSYFRFVLGVYDDGSDQELQRIKNDEMIKIKSVVSAHALVAATWLVNCVIIYVCGVPSR